MSKATLRYVVSTEGDGRPVVLRSYVNAKRTPRDELVFSGPLAQEIGLELIAKARETMPPALDDPDPGFGAGPDLDAPLPTDIAEAGRQCRTLMADPRYWKHRDARALRRVAALSRMLYPARATDQAGTTIRKTEGDPTP